MYFTQQETARKTGYSAAVISKAIQDGQLRAFRPKERCYLIEECDIEAWVETRKKLERTKPSALRLNMVADLRRRLNDQISENNQLRTRISQIEQDNAFSQVPSLDHEFDLPAVDIDFEAHTSPHPIDVDISPIFCIDDASLVLAVEPEMQTITIPLDDIAEHSQPRSMLTRLRGFARRLVKKRRRDKENPIAIDEAEWAIDLMPEIPKEQSHDTDADAHRDNPSLVLRLTHDQRPQPSRP